jgi:cytochrome c-type biogenesis protein
MVSILFNFWIAFLAGLFAPIGAVCVLPLYPGFLAYLAGQLGKNNNVKEKNVTSIEAFDESANKRKIILFGIVVTFGVIISMLIIGLIVSFFLKASLTKAIFVVSPIAFGLLAVISLLLIFNVDVGRFFPKFHAPVLKNPLLSSFVFGLFFGAIVLPCNPASLAILFAVSTSVSSFVTNFFNFLLFGIGMALPLLILSVVSASWSKVVIGFLTKYKRWINIVAGIVMLLISLYYLIFVFKMFG